jgi:hypothetical protein
VLSTSASARNPFLSPAPAPALRLPAAPEAEAEEAVSGLSLRLSEQMVECGFWAMALHSTSISVEPKAALRSSNTCLFGGGVVWCGVAWCGDEKE